MIELYKYLLEEHHLKNVHIKPYNILQSAQGGLKVYHLDTSNKLPSFSGAQSHATPSHGLGFQLGSRAN